MAQPRRSSLAGRNATTSPVVQPERTPQEAPEVSQESEQAPVAAPAPTEASKASQGRTVAPKSKKKKVSFYQHPEEEERARKAWMHTMGHTGHTTITSFMEAAVANYTRQLEAEHNDAKPFS